MICFYSEFFFNVKYRACLKILINVTKDAWKRKKEDGGFDNSKRGREDLVLNVLRTSGGNTFPGVE